MPGWKKALIVREEKRAQRKDLEIEQYRQLREKRIQEQKKKDDEAHQAKLKLLQQSLQKSNPSIAASLIPAPKPIVAPLTAPLHEATMSSSEITMQKTDSSNQSESSNAPRRARTRRPMAGPSTNKPKIDFSEPQKYSTPFNCSEVIKNFLFLGAGFDVNGRCLTNRQGDPPALRAERLAWFRQNNVSYALNMAASPLQEQLVGIEYPPPEIRIKGIDMNDLDEWVPEMARMFDEGAAFIEEACNDHLNVQQQCIDQQATNPPGTVQYIYKKPPGIFVHCVAGVNRSPMVVVWWLAKYHGFSVKDAWDLVRNRRDAGAQWSGITLGGAVSDDVENGNVISEDSTVEKDLTSPSSYQWVEVPQVGEKKKPHPKLEWYKHAKDILGNKLSLKDSKITTSPTNSRTPPPIAATTTAIGSINSSIIQQKNTGSNINNFSSSSISPTLQAKQRSNST